jgi:hypothetical protein
MDKMITPAQGPAVFVTVKTWSAEKPEHVVVVHADGVPVLQADEARRLGVLLIEAAAETERTPDDDWPAG